MKLSIVIVNYNVSHFLEQCLISVYNALQNMNAEVFVVDNNSVDGSVDMVREKFPQAICIANQENVGFSRANNQAIRQAKGEYVLLLNPDTVVQEDTFSKCVQFMDAHPDAGGLGVRMIDGMGNFLPESKRGLPTPLVAFYKLSGLIRLFPKSKRYGRYYMGHLPNKKNNSVEVLAGAFMLMRQTALNKVGLLDEDYFMYGEDIDLSYRIIKGGFKNYYFADTEIIHYKGESTKKGSLNYVFIFYRAMQIFAQKHFSSGQARLYSILINMAIWMRAGVSILGRLVRNMAIPVLDGAIIYGGMYYLKLYWEHNHRFVQGGQYPDIFMQMIVPIYILLWLVGVYFSGGYDRPTKSWNLWRGLAIGTLLLFAFYGLLPELYRFSRALIILGTIWASVALPLWRWAFQKATGKRILTDAKASMRRIIVGSKNEFKRIEQLLAQTGVPAGFCGWINTGLEKNNAEVGDLNQLDEILKIYRINEVIFCAKDISSQDIISQMRVLQPHHVEIKIAPPESLFVIGSNSINTQGEWYTVQVNTIAQPENKRLKRLIDIVGGTLFLALSPLLFWVQKRPFKFPVNCLQVLVGFKTWVGYNPNGTPENLPKLKPGVLFSNHQIGQKELDKQTLERINFLYAKEYNPQVDVEIILKNLRLLGH